MAQVSFYVPDEIEKGIRREARFHRKSVSAYLSDVVKEQIGHDKWQAGFFTEVAGKWSGDFPALERPPPEEKDLL